MEAGASRRGRLHVRRAGRPGRIPGRDGKIAYMSYPDGAKTINPDGTGDAVFDTTLDALVPGSVAEGSRTIQALGQVRVFDGGPDENADTAADNALLAVQGVFVP